MRKNLTLAALLAGISVLAIGNVAVAQTALIAGYDEAVMAAEEQDWATAESERGGLYLVAQFDSSGPDAWNPEEHPLVYITSESNYNPNPNKTIEGGFAGFHLIDAYSREVIIDHIGVQTAVADAPQFGDLSEEDLTGPIQLRRAPHGVVTSPDGKWAYYGWTEIDPSSSTGTVSYVAVTNMQTMKIDKLLRQEHYFRGGPRAQSLHHIQAWEDEDGNQRVVLQFGFGANGGPHFILDPQDDNRVVRALNYEDVQLMGHPFTTPSPDGKTLYVSIGSPELRSSHYTGAGIAKVSLEEGGGITNIMGTGNHPIGITHDVDGRFTYVVDGHHSAVYKIDNETDEVVGSTSAGVAGPYGISFNWDESLLFTVGKGEGTHNVGSALGVIDARIFSRWRGRHQMPLFLGGSASSIDHAILHPDPELNELWISNMNGWETIVFDLENLEPVDWIPTPNGGDTHSGGFIQYDADFNGELLIDMGGAKSEIMRERIRAAKAGN